MAPEAGRSKGRRASPKATASEEAKAARRPLTAPGSGLPLRTAEAVRHRRQQAPGVREDRPSGREAASAHLREPPPDRPGPGRPIYKEGGSRAVSGPARLLPLPRDPRLGPWVSGPRGRGGSIPLAARGSGRGVPRNAVHSSCVPLHGGWSTSRGLGTPHHRRRCRHCLGRTRPDSPSRGADVGRETTAACRAAPGRGPSGGRQRDRWRLVATSSPDPRGAAVGRPPGDVRDALARLRQTK